MLKEEAIKLHNYISTALKNLPVLGREALVGEDAGKHHTGEKAVFEYLIEQSMWLQAGFSYETIPMAAWYQIVEMTDKELLGYINDNFDVMPRYALANDHEHPNVKRMLELLGPAGQQLLAKRAERRHRAKEHGD